MDNDLTTAQWESLLEVWGGCAYCRMTSPALQRDCIVPISRGGRYTLTNVVPACASCNASKHNGEVTEWLRRKKLDEGAFLLRQATILRTLSPGNETGSPELDARESGREQGPSAPVNRTNH